MTATLRPNYSFEEYLSREKVAEGKSEYYRGQIFAMTGGSARHNSININIVINLGGRLRGSPCRLTNSDQRIRIPANGLATYPDLSIICGGFEFDQQDEDAIVNPTVIFEILSKSTEGYDRGKKFELYRQLDSLQEYILVSQDAPHIDRFVRQADGSWNLTIFHGLESTLEIRAVAASIPFSEFYDNINFDLEATDV